MKTSPPSTEHPEGENETRPASTSSIPVVEYIDCTPTWEGILPTWFHIIDACGVTDIVRAELTNMARAADRWNQHCKEMQGE